MERKLMKKPRFEIIAFSRNAVFIKDLGPWDIHYTITNTVESVVMALFLSGVLGENKRLFYSDSQGVVSEISWEGNGTFLHFNEYDDDWAEDLCWLPDR